MINRCQIVLVLRVINKSWLLVHVTITIALMYLQFRCLRFPPTYLFCTHVLAISVLAFSTTVDLYLHFAYMHFPSLSKSTFFTCKFRTCIFQYLHFQRPHFHIFSAPISIHAMCEMNTQVMCTVFEMQLTDLLSHSHHNSDGLQLGRRISQTTSPTQMIHDIIQTNCHLYATQRHS